MTNSGAKGAKELYYRPARPMARGPAFRPSPCQAEPLAALRVEELESDACEGPVVAPVDRGVLFIGPAVAHPTTLDEDGSLPERDRDARLIFQDIVLQRERCRVEARRGVLVGQRYRGSPIDARVIPDAAEERDELVEVGQLFTAESPAVEVGVAVVVGDPQITHADVDTRLKHPYG